MIKKNKLKYFIFFLVAIAISLTLQFSNKSTHAEGNAIQTENKLYKFDRKQNVVPIENNGNKKIALLTIDGCPKGKETLEPILKALQDENVHAIFFCIGETIKANPDLLKKIHDDGNIIGNHSWDHPNFKDINNFKIKEEIDNTNKIVNDTIGENPKIFRPPYGAITNFTKNYIKKNKMLFVTWSLDTQDWMQKNQTKEAVIKNIVTKLHPGANILMHELPWTSEAMPEIIKQIKMQGYTIINPSEIEGL